MNNMRLSEGYLPAKSCSGNPIKIVAVISCFWLMQTLLIHIMNIDFFQVNFRLNADEFSD
ncbi:hypothetical protein ASG44_00015 [Methylophilus sp. Leaf459]|nr:hypothetical protein ASG34_00010 [Methylophilus sp. Leaf416]KQT58721.1 hypothetical protein ASG44_00015 [Methylophilus sp. Leaf459]